MKASNRRKEERIPFKKRATLVYENSALPCLLQDISGSGFFIISNEQFFVGQVLELEVELYPDKTLQCRIEIRHISDTCLGTQIVDISADGAALLKRYLEEYYSLKLNQST